MNVWYFWGISICFFFLNTEEIAHVRKRLTYLTVIYELMNMRYLVICHKYSFIHRYVIYISHSFFDEYVICSTFIYFTYYKYISVVQQVVYISLFLTWNISVTHSFNHIYPIITWWVWKKEVIIIYRIWNTRDVV